MGAVTAAVPTVRTLVLVLVLAAPSAFAQPIDPSLVGKVLGPVVDPVVADAVTRVENVTGEDLHGEDIRVAIVLDVVNIDYQVIGIVFGGGKVAADGVCAVRLEFRGVSATRLDEAIRSATGDANASLNSTFGVPTGRIALTAEEVRIIGAGALLAYFQAYEAVKAQELLQDTLPGLSLLGVTLQWSNTMAASSVREGGPPGVPDVDPTQPASLLGAAALPPLRDPPLVLDAQARLNYLTRISLAEMLRPEPSRDDNATVANGTRDDLKQRLQEEQGERFLDRTAFNLMGFGQLVNVSVPPGWRVDVGVNVPKGYTVEGATDELVVAGDRRGVGIVLDGLDRTQAANPVGLATLSNRFLVTVIVLAAVLIAAFALRLPLEAAVLAVHQHAYVRRRRRVQARERTRAAIDLGLQRQAADAAYSRARS